MKQVKKWMAYIREHITEEEFRYRFQFWLVSAILGTISFFMTLVNIVTQQYTLMWVTLCFFVFCTVFMLCYRRVRLNLTIWNTVFTLAIYILFTFFLVSGIPDGFSVLWIAMLPACGMLLYGRRRGSIAFAGMLLIVLFFFQTPWGLSLLQYGYTDTFRMRFPMLLVAFYVVSLFLETVRVWTYQALRRSQHQYAYLYKHDALTGVYNRYGFNEYLQMLMNDSLRPGVVFMIVDVDHFKRVNDRYGHMKGDEVLIEVAGMVSDSFAEEGAVCRWGGEEFAVLIEDVWTPQQAEQQAEALRQKVENRVIDMDSSNLRLTVSIGAITAAGDRSGDMNRLINETDRCLYEAKAQGRNRVVCRAL